MTMPAFDLARPTSVRQAADLLASPGARLIAGGTDLVPNLLRGIERPTLLIDLGGVQDLAAIAYDGRDLMIGAGATLARIAGDERIARDFAAIAQAAHEVAAPAHRNAGTLGGNLCLDTRCVFYNQSEWWRAANHWCLKRGGDTCHVAPQGQRCHAAFSGDLAPALIALDAQVEIASAAGTRRMPLAELYRDDGAAHLTLAPGELVAHVHVRKRDALRSGYRKARVRGGIDFPLAGVAIALAMDGECIARLRVALTGTNAQPLALPETDAFIGRRIDTALFAELAKRVAKAVSPMRTTVTASNYRRQVACVLARRLVADLAAS
ncbi:MAG: 4-hydroxybenzoyl-CoA reductase subunit beta [Burkholderiales bacterium]|nr:4-hydroxybenzoyl-CoA reductase subunit beta [Burkholderiales bacterium]